MKILVTGGAGFIGSHIAQAYLAQGHHVWVVDDLSIGNRKNVPAGAEFRPWDIADKRVAKLLAAEKIELINHHAAHIDLRESMGDPVGDARVNILGLLGLLESARAAGVKRIIFASTGGALYGKQERFPARESDRLTPMSPYAVSKLAGEKYLEYYQRVYGFIPQVLRYANVYGPRQNPACEAGVVAIFTGKMLRGQRPLIHGSGKQTRDFVYVGDVMQANVLALAHAKPCVFNVGTGRETDIVTIFKGIQRQCKFPLEAIHGDPKAGDQMRSVISPAAIRSAWGWKPRVSLNSGLKDTVAWFKAARQGA